MDAYAVLRFKTKKSTLVYTSQSEPSSKRERPPSDAIELLPEERLALFRLILEVQEKGQNSLKWTVKELADVCDSNIASIHSLIPKLKGCGLIKSDIMRPTTHGGRTSFIVTSVCRDLLKQSARPEGHPIRALQQRVLLPEYGYNPEKKKRGGFSRSNRWLLAVLLEHSDPNGVIDDLGGAELRSLTGFTKERLRVQIKQLKCLGFLHAVSPGISGDPFFGIKSSVYYLNLHHPYFESDRLSGFTILIKNRVIDEANAFPEIDQLKQIQREVLSKSKKPVATLESVKKINYYRSKYLMSYVKQPVLYHFESVVARMTSFYLSEYFDRTERKVDKARLLLSSMVSDQQSQKLEKTERIDFNNQKSFVCEISKQRKRELIPFLEKYSELDPEELSGYNYVVLPLDYCNRKPRITFAIEAFPEKKNNKGFKCLLIKTGINSKGEIASICEQTEELTAEQRHAFGFINAQMLQKVKALGMSVFDGSSTSDSPET